MATLHLPPEDPGQQLSIDDLAALLEELDSVCAKWYNIGMKLGVHVGRLDAIRAQYRDLSDCLRETLAAWLRACPTPTTWSKVVEALKSATVNEGALATSLKHKYCSSIPPDTTTPSHPHPHSATLAVSLDEQSVAAAAAVTLPPHNVPTTPPHHPTQEHMVLLDRRSVKQHVEQLEDHFLELTECTYEILVEKGINVHRLHARLVSLDVSRRHEHQEFVDKHLMNVDQNTTFNNLWARLGSYWDFLNFDLLEHIIKKFGSEDLKQRMESYKCDLRSFRRSTRLCDFIDCWPVRGQSPPIAELRMFVGKVGYHWDSCTLEDLEMLRGVITRKFFLPGFALQLGKIMEGSITITWLIPAPFVKALHEAIETTSSEFFVEHQIEAITIDGKVCYPSPARKPIDYPKELTTFQTTPQPAVVGVAQKVQGRFGYRAVKLIKTKPLGTGSYGAVYKAMFDDLPCAGKILHLSQSNDPGAMTVMKRFQQECSFLSAIRHPNIVQYFGVHQDPDTQLPVLLMELMDESLTRFLEHSQEPLPYHTQVDICHDIALALAYLHSNGIIHRNLSSNNVLLIGRNKAKVTDFGMAKVFDVSRTSMTPLTMCPGTLAYMSPEALQDQPVYTKKLDTFSFGVLDIQIITRQFPNPGPRLKKVQDSRYPTGSVQVAIPDTERRKSHIDLINPSHPLLPIATVCLSYNEEDRPSAQRLCCQLAVLKDTPQYSDSVQQAQERSKSAQSATADRERQIMELQVSGGQIREKDAVIAARQQEMQHLQQLTRRWSSWRNTPQPTRDMVVSPCWGVSTGRFAGVSNVDPTTVTDDRWVRVEPPCAPSQKTLGKWLVFKPLEELDETWHMIRRAVESEELDSTGAKCSTACAVAKPSSHTMDRSTGVICVYTSEETMDEVGFKLVHMVKQDIPYKTDEATLQGKYVATGYRNVSLQTIYWNDGNPYLKKLGEAKASAPRVDPSRLPMKPPYTAYLGNLSYDCTTDDVLEFFERRNINVLSVRLPLESETHQTRFGYAELENTQALMEALSLSGEPLRGRPVRMNIAGESWRSGRDRDDRTVGDWRQGMRDEGERNLPPDEGHSQGGYHYRGRRGYDRYCDRGPPRRYERGSHHRDSYDDRGPPRRYDEDHHRDPYGDHGPPRRYDEGHHHRDPYGDHGPPRRYDKGHHHRDLYESTSSTTKDMSLLAQSSLGRYERGSHPQQRSLEDRYDPYGSDGYRPQRRSLEDRSEWGRKSDELPKERPRLQLQSRTKPPEDTSGGRGGGRASSSIFGQAKPVDTAARDREIEERLLRERAETEERGDRSLTDEGGKRGGRRNESRQRERADRRGRYDSSGRGERRERYDRSERGERRGRHDSSGQRKRRERSTSDSSDRGERRDGTPPPHDGCQDTTEATGWGGRRRESYEEEEERASEPGRGRGNDDPASPTKK